MSKIPVHTFLSLSLLPLVPSATSLKVLAELPIIVVLHVPGMHITVSKYSGHKLHLKTMPTCYIYLNFPGENTANPLSTTCMSPPPPPPTHFSLHYPVQKHCIAVTSSPPPPPLSLSLSLSLQLYKQTVHKYRIIPLTMKTLVLQPSAKARQAPDFNREAYVDFVAVQIKFL